MKILQIHNEYIYKGGEDAVVEAEKDLLRNKNHKVFQVIRKNKDEITNVIDKFKIAVNLNYSSFSKKIISNKLKEVDPDIVHIHNIFPLWTFSVLDACIEMNVPVVMTLHNYRLICAKGVFYRNDNICEKCIKSSSYNATIFGCYQGSKIKSLPVSFAIDKSKKGLSIINKINKLIVLTEFSKNKFLEANFPENKITVKPNFIFDNSKKYIDLNKKGFLYASRLTEEKGLLDLIEAYKKYHFDLTVCGDGPLRKKLISYKNINYLGFLDKENLLKIMGKSKFLIFPSKWYEGFPIILLEAFALETIVIAPNLGSIANIIKHEQNGLLFRPGDSEDLANKIRLALTNESKCDEIKKNAKKEFESKYSHEVNYKMLIKIYEEAIKENQNN